MRNHSIFTLAIIALLAGAAAEAKYSGGTGEPNDPYKIATAEELNDIGNHDEDWNKHFILINDVNLAGYTGTQFKIIGNGWTYFTGVFDGKNHKVWNFTWSSLNREDYIGLFRWVGEGGQIKNLGMENVNIKDDAEGSCNIGGLVGWNYGTITNCYSTGNITVFGDVGLLVGNNGGTINACYSSGTVSGDSGLGGLVGYNYGTINACYSTGDAFGSSNIGGLVGSNGFYGTITNCYSTGDAVGAFINSRSIGGLAGNNLGNITACYATGSVSGSNNSFGGLAGRNGGTITNSYSTGSISGYEDVGGLVGSNYKVVDNNWIGLITNCYSTGSVTGWNSVGGLVGENYKG
jgi:hypothetical protein